MGFCDASRSVLSCRMWSVGCAKEQDGARSVSALGIAAGYSGTLRLRQDRRRKNLWICDDTLERHIEVESIAPFLKAHAEQRVAA